MEISFNSKIRVSDSAVQQQQNGKSIILNTQSEKFYSLDEVATRILTVLLQSESIQQGFDLLLKEYDVEPEILKRDIFTLIRNLVRQDLVRIHP